MIVLRGPKALLLYRLKLIGLVVYVVRSAQRERVL